MDPRFSTESAFPLPTVLYQPPPRTHFHTPLQRAPSASRAKSQHGHSRALSKDSGATGLGTLHQSTSNASGTRPYTAKTNESHGPPTRQRSKTLTKAASSSVLTSVQTRNIDRANMPSLKASFERSQASGTTGTRPTKFTVGNVSHGRLYLKPSVVRPAHELHQYTLPPNTPPNSVGDEEKEGDRQKDSWQGKSKLEVDGPDDEAEVDAKGAMAKSGIPSIPLPKTPPPEGKPYAFLESSPPVMQPKRIVRNRSYSIQEKRTKAVEAPKPGAFKIEIGLADPIERPKTAAPQRPFPGLDVQIPHYNIGSPRFSPSGTPFLQSSTNGDSNLNIPSMFGERGSHTTSLRNSQYPWIPPAGVDMSEKYGSMKSFHDRTPFLSPPESPGDSGAPSSFLFPPTPAMQPDPSIFDALTFPPESEDPSVIRYDPNTKELVAATPARIIAQITSATFLDYQLLSDFFLTFRLFVAPIDLVSFLIARLHWAIERDDDTGRVVRVRTFVAIRHWILNYFADDFVPSIQLRETFAEKLNALSHAVAEKGSPSDLKILAEIKRCWKRTCALYWDKSAERQGSVSDSVDADITPGGEPGERRDLRDSYFPRFPLEPPMRLDKGKEKALDSNSNSWPRRGKRPRASLPAHIVEATMGGDGHAASRNGSMAASKSAPQNIGGYGEEVSDEIVVDPTLIGQAKGHPSRSGSDISFRGQSISSPNSSKDGLHATSPFLSTFKFPPAPQPASNPGSPFASSQALSRRMHEKRPGSHKRSGSFSDALRDNRQPLPIQHTIARSTHLLMAFPYGSSLVRGNILPPSNAFVEILAPTTPGSTLTRAAAKNAMTAGTKQTPGMKKLLNNMRKALGGKGSSSNVDIHVRTDSPPLIMGRYSSPAAPESPLTPIARERPQFPPAPVKTEDGITRIDLLGAGAVEAFQRALQDEGRKYDDPMGAAIDENNATMPSTMRGALVSPSNSSSNVGRDNPTPLVDPSVDLASTKSSSKRSLAGDWQHLSQASLPENTRPEVGSEKHLAALREFERRVGVETDSLSGFSFTDDQIRASTPVKERRDEDNGFDDTQDLTPLPAHEPSFRSASFDEKSLRTARSVTTLASRRPFSDYSVDAQGEGFEYTTDLSSPAHARLTNDPYDRPPNRLLKRRPGGNLRGVSNIAELEPSPEERHRPSSFGSFSITGSLASTHFLPPARVMSPLSIGSHVDDATSAFMSDEESQFGQNMLSLGAVAAGATKLSPRHSDRQDEDARSYDSEAHTPTEGRTSFERGVAKLALLADNTSEDGGVDVALMKLEGKYDRQSKMSPIKDYFERTFFGEGRVSQMPPNTAETVESVPAFRSSEASGIETQKLRVKRRHKQILENHPLDTPPAFAESTNASYFALGPGSIGRENSEDGKSVLEPGIALGSPASSRLVMRRGYSDSSVPILEREQFNSMESTKLYAPHPSSDFQHSHQNDLESNVQLKDKDKQNELRDDISELSSEISFEVLDKTPTGNERVDSGSTAAEIFAGLDLPAHPLRHPPSPPLTLRQALHLPPDDEDEFILPPANAPASHMKLQKALSYPSQPSVRQQNQNQQKPQEKEGAANVIFEATPVHLPFILAYDSELLAKQFTLIEKDALNEVDWKELVELNWKHASTPVHDWVEFLSNSDVRGVEVVIARFNLVWKWAVSEIVMTRDLHERARTIVKLIHIAAHCRALQNYATMYQLTASLLSTNVARLKATWKLISPADMATFHSLEALVQPVRNFHNLRVEMDKIHPDFGCVPFVGLFTHDLIYNAQRPSTIPSSIPGGQPLVNFEKHRMTSAIVKRLLRLVEASSNYKFGVVDGVAERCLWISCLGDREITGLSRGLE